MAGRSNQMIRKPKLRSSKLQTQMPSDEDMSMSMVDTAHGEGVEIVANVLKHLSAKELREARLVNQDFNLIICTHPELLWAKNRIFVNIEPTNDSKGLKWVELFRLDLMTRYCCPNVHFYKTNLLSPGAHKFFRSSIPPQLKHLKMTGCDLKIEALLCILNRASSNLEHLEIIGFSHIKLKKLEQMDPAHTKLHLHSLRTIILRGQSDKRRQRQRAHISNCGNLSLKFLTCVFRGAPNLTRISFTGWSPETCQALVQVLTSLPLGHVKGIQSLELSCSMIQDSFQSDVEPYVFIKGLEFIELPSLREFAIRYDRELDAAAGLTPVIVEELSHSLAAFLESTADNLEVLELCNCPVSSAIFGQRISSFSKLFRVNTRGSFVSLLNTDDVNNNPRELRQPTPEVQNLRSLEGSRPSTPRVPGALPEVPGSVQRMEIYTLISLFFFFAILVHVAFTIMFDKFPSIGRKLEMLTYVCGVLWLSRGSGAQRRLCRMCARNAFINLWLHSRPAESS